MSAPTNHFKLGVFVLAAIGALVGTAILFGANAARRQTVLYHTFFNESVQGLDISSPVKFRGVPIGVVSAIDIAPDRRHVDVSCELDVDDLRRMGLTEEHVGGPLSSKVKFLVPDDLRSQLGSQGITGVKFIALDFFDPISNPAPELAFATPPNTIPAAASLMKTLEDSIVQAVEQLPEVAASVLSSLEKIDIMLEELRGENVPQKAAQAIDDASAALNEVRTVLRRFDDARVPQKAAKAIENLDRAVSKVSLLMDQMGGKDGLVASAQEATDQFGEVGRSAHGTAGELESTLRDVSEAARSVRELARALRRDPDMLIKGRADGSTP